VRFVVDGYLDRSRSRIIEMREGDFVLGPNLLTNNNLDNDRVSQNKVAKLVEGDKPC
jgi:hypothetical protein